jgi:hypothetical protein
MAALVFLAYARMWLGSAAVVSLSTLVPVGWMTPLWLLTMVF